MIQVLAFLTLHNCHNPHKLDPNLQSPLLQPTFHMLLVRAVFHITRANRSLSSSQRVLKALCKVVKMPLKAFFLVILSIIFSDQASHFLITVTPNLPKAQHIFTFLPTSVLLLHFLLCLQSPDFSSGIQFIFQGRIRMLPFLKSISSLSRFLWQFILWFTVGYLSDFPFLEGNSFIP